MQNHTENLLIVISAFGKPSPRILKKKYVFYIYTSELSKPPIGYF